MKIFVVALLVFFFSAYPTKVFAQTLPDYILKTNGDSLSHIEIKKVSQSNVQYRRLDRGGTLIQTLRKVARIRYQGKIYEFNPTREERIKGQLDRATKRN